MMLDQNGRRRHAVTRASMDMVVCWRDEAELERRLGVFRRLLPTQLANVTTMELRDRLRAMLGHMIDGTPQDIIEQVRAYEAAGLDGLMIDWFDCEDLEGLQVLAAEVLSTVDAP